MSVVKIAPRPARPRGVQRVKSAATRAALVAAARARFAEAGYHATAANDLVALASMTRGALYHHFKDKQDLFEAVCRQVYDELSLETRVIVAHMSGDTWHQLVTALATLLKKMAESAEARRILLIDAPAVFGWEHWRALQAGTLEGIEQTLRLLIEEGVVAPRPPGLPARLIVAALNEAAQAIAHAPDPHAALEASTDALLAFVSGLRNPQDRAG